MATHEIRLAAQSDIAIMRCENGWVIRTEHEVIPVGKPYTPLKVAHTVDMLVDIVREWAEAPRPVTPPEKTW